MFKPLYSTFIPLLLFNAVLMSIEMVGPRLLAPYFGITSFTWTSMISVTLLGISIGYFIGGVLFDRIKNQAWLYSAIIIITAVYIILVAVFKHVVLNFLLHNSSVLWGTILSAFVLFLIPCIGIATIPVVITAKFLQKHTQEKGKKLGLVLGVSTFGSLVGIFCTTFLLIPYIGSEAILYLFAIILAVSLLFLPFKKNVLWIVLLVSFSAYAGITTKQNISIVDIDSFYQRIFVYQTIDEKNKDSIRVLQLNNQINSGQYLAKPTELVYPYNQKIFDIIKHKKKKESILLLGGASFSLPVTLSSEFAKTLIDVVEIDPMVVKVSEKYFLKDPFNFTVYVDDARHYMNVCSKKYDVIILDVFTSLYNIPDFLATAETFKKLSSMLQPEGYIIINTLGSLTGKHSAFVSNVHYTAKAYFSFASVIPVQDPKMYANIQNIILFFSSDSLQPHNFINTSSLKKGTLLTDNFSPHSILQCLP